MASSFPGGLDSFTNPTATDTLDSATVPHADQHANANDAIEAIESTLGVNPQGGSASVSARLTALDSTVAGKVVSVTAGDSTVTVAGTSTAPTVAVNAIATTKVTGLLADLVKNPDLLIVGSITRNSNDVVTSAAVVWPDGTVGTFTADTINSTFGTIDAYNVTYGSPVTKTYYQDAVTRNSNGAVTNLPAIRVV